MHSLNEFIQQFETALNAKDWATIADLDVKMRPIVSNENSLLQGMSESRRADAQYYLNQQLSKLRQLYLQAEQLAVQLKQQTGEQIQLLGTGKAGVSAYQDNARL